MTGGAPCTVKLYGDGQLVHTATFTAKGPKRLPHGRWDEIQVEVSCAERVATVMLASTTEELKGV
jgi:hypothetical protein